MFSHTWYHLIMRAFNHFIPSPDTHRLEGGHALRAAATPTLGQLLHVWSGTLITNERPVSTPPLGPGGGGLGVQLQLWGSKSWAPFCSLSCLATYQASLDLICERRARKICTTCHSATACDKALGKLLSTDVIVGSCYFHKHKLLASPFLCDNIQRLSHKRTQPVLGVRQARSRSWLHHSRLGGPTSIFFFSVLFLMLCSLSAGPQLSLSVSLHSLCSWKAYFSVFPSLSASQATISASGFFPPNHISAPVLRRAEIKFSSHQGLQCDQTIRQGQGIVCRTQVKVLSLQNGSNRFSLYNSNTL